MQKITPFLWFDNNAEEAMNFYVSLFKNSKVVQSSRYGDAGPGMKGSFMVGTFSLEGQEFMVLNGGPHYKLTPAFSLMVNCETQEEVDFYWDKLTEGGIGSAVRLAHGQVRGVVANRSQDVCRVAAAGRCREEQSHAQGAVRHEEADHCRPAKGVRRITEVGREVVREKASLFAGHR